MARTRSSGQKASGLAGAVQKRGQKTQTKKLPKATAAARPKVTKVKINAKTKARVSAEDQRKKKTKTKSVTKAKSKVTEAKPPDDGKKRCFGNDSYIGRRYHDERWGRELQDPDELFALFCLEFLAAGLSWTLILRKEEGLRAACDNFDYRKICRYTEKDLERLLQDPRMIRNRLKVKALVTNAKLVADMEKKKKGLFLKFALKHAPSNPAEKYLASGKHRESHMRSDFKTPATERFESDGVHPTVSVAKFTKDAREAGFKFVGETTLLSFWQAMGAMNHHAKDCFAFQECKDAETWK